MGRLLIARDDHPNIDIRVKLAKPISLQDYRIVRKLLEMSSNELHLFTNGDTILGLAELPMKTYLS